MNRYYPLMLNVENKRCIVVGGGAVAERKVAGLLEAGAEVVVIAQTVTVKLLEMAAGGFIAVVEREYRKEDLADAVLVFAATNCRFVNACITADAKAANIPVNTADRSEEGTFVTPSSLRRGSLLLAVTTSGASPALAARTVKELEEKYGEEYASFTSWLRRIRVRAIALVDVAGDRQALLKAALDVPQESWRTDIDEHDIDRRIRMLLQAVERRVRDEYEA